MKLLDARGRFMGRIHLVDLLALLFLLGLSPLLFFTREVARNQQPKITDVAPATVVPGSRIRLRGTNFHWDQEVYIGDRRAVRQRYYGTDAIVAYVPPDLPPGRYPVRLERGKATATRWEGLLEVRPSPGWVDEPIVVGFLFRHLTPEETRICWESADPALKRISAEPKILYIWKEGAEETLLHLDGRDAGRGGWLFAEVVLLARVQPSAEHPVYYYDGQPLGDRLPVRLKMAGRTWDTTVDWEPEPLFMSAREGSG